MQTLKVQISKCIRAVWPEHSLFIYLYSNYSIHWFCKRATEAWLACAKAQADQGLRCPQIA